MRPADSRGELADWRGCGDSRRTGASPLRRSSGRLICRLRAAEQLLPAEAFAVVTVPPRLARSFGFLRTKDARTLMPVRLLTRLNDHLHNSTHVFCSDHDRVSNTSEIGSCAFADFPDTVPGIIPFFLKTSSLSWSEQAGGGQRQERVDSPQNYLGSKMLRCHRHEIPGPSCKN
jgi:hypothetical protein